jgi:membrane protein DedA with SNARE-associated domain
VDAHGDPPASGAVRVTIALPAASAAIDPFDGESMDDTLRFLVEHGYLVLFVLVLAEQIGLPLPAVPVLMGAGALAGMDRLDGTVAVGVATAASLLSDGLWYQIGRTRGGKVLKLLCRISLEPDSCVRTTENTFARYGARSLLVAKFVPGLNTIAPPMAGITGMAPLRFFLLDGLGSLFYVGFFVAIGWVWSDQLEAVAKYLAGFGSWGLVIVGGALAAYVLAKLVQRRLFLRELRIARITPEELKERMERGEELVVVDLRHSADFETTRVTIPGSIRVAIDEIEQGHERIPRDREIVLFCT